jgi:hypothetical protein
MPWLSQPVPYFCQRGNGRKLRYSLKKWGRRWMVEGLGTGW